MIRALLVGALLATSAQAQDIAPRIAGTIELTDGDVLLEGKDRKTRLPVNSENVFEGDTVTTFPNGEIHLQMADGASLIVRENSKITIAEYVADGGEGDRSLIELAKGALRSITGWIGQYNRSNYKIRTPLVTIGVRGTDHEPSHLLDGDPRGEPGSYDKVNEGRAFMQGPDGVVEVPANRAVFRARARGARPRLLASVPAFFRPGRFERRFVERARGARKTIVERRQARREFLRRERGGRQLQPNRSLKDAPRRELRKAERPPRPQAQERRERRRSARDQRQ
ncbi:MAG: FecR domain-containing protein [Betaproteobacteria bacterium]|nr:FecR domain-containing protein [Betaproteobacteria bacterium]